MDKKNIHNLELEIAKCRETLAKLEPQISKNPNVARIYNKMLVKKAVLQKKYKQVQIKPSLKEKLKKLLGIHRRKKLICEYFHTEV